MAVFTEVSFEEAGELLERLRLGKLHKLEGCAGGIENTNYFVSTDQGDYVLTLFERLSLQQLPFYLRLMKHLALNGIPVPDPAADCDGESCTSSKVNRLQSLIACVAKANSIPNRPTVQWSAQCWPTCIW